MNNTINLISRAAESLFADRKFRPAAELMTTALDLTSDMHIKNNICNNARMSWFLANDAQKAYDIWTRQRDLALPQNWEFQRDVVNYLRYLKRYDEARTEAEKITDDDFRNLAMSWFLHIDGHIRDAFVMTERARQGKYWWGAHAPRYKWQMWQGEPVENLVVIPESGHGDQIIFSRWIPQAKKIAKNVFVDGSNTLERVFHREFDIPVFDRANPPRDLYGIPVVSLPYVLEVDDPSPTRYLSAQDRLVEMYGNRLAHLPRPLIGLCTHGEPTHVETTLRTLPFTDMVEALCPLGSIINLEKEPYHRDSRIFYPDFSCWDDTLALLEHCDVVVTCDTSISHAAGALGRPTVVLMHAAAYFTWNHHTTVAKSRWYDDAWCVHQDLPCDWTGAISRSIDIVKSIIAKE